jgi:peptide/nickel transport system permease protein
LRRILWRLVQALPILLGIVTITFVVVRQLGDPVASIAGPLASVEEVEALRERLGLNEPLLTQYWHYLGHLVHGDLGSSLVNDRPIVHELRDRVGGTLELIVLGTFFAAIWGVILGALSAYLRRAGRVFHGIAVLGLAIPDFVLGLVLGLVFAFQLGWAPSPVGQLDLIDTPPPRVTGGVALDSLIAGNWGQFTSALGYLVLPVLTLSLIYGAPIAKLAENAFTETRRRAFIEYAELAGLPRWRVFRYTLRNALPAILTLSGVIAGYLVGGIVLVEIVFSWGGLGQYAAQSILAVDMPAIQGFVLLAGAFTLLVYLLLDIAYGLIDPRVRTA